MLIAMPTGRAESLAAQCASRVLPDHGGRWVRLRDLMMPVWAEFYYEVVFGRPCPAPVRDLIVGNADDVVTALKCCGLRHSVAQPHPARARHLHGVAARRLKLCTRHFAGQNDDVYSP